ncbi:MAG: serine/threonine-protein kinase [Leifsonia sp.]
MSSLDNAPDGSVIAGRYELLGVVGRGGMATVYRARDRKLGRLVAVKLFAAGTAIDDARRRAEVDLLGRVNHPNLVALHDAHLAPADSDEPSYLVMELVEGPDLRTMLDAGPIAGATVAALAAEIAEALAAVHGQGIVHRDLKPANILLAPSGIPSPEYRARLTDFGIAHLVGADRVTTAGTVIGTAAYLSPEQATGSEPGPETDVYALGLVLLECLTGTRAYPGTAIEAMSARVVRDPAVPDDLPVAWASLLTQMTSRDPALRPTALDVAVRAKDHSAELSAWAPAVVLDDGSADETVAMLPPTMVMAGSGSDSANPVTASAPSSNVRRGLIAAAAAVVVAGALITGTVLVVSGGDPSSDQVQTPVSTPAPSPIPSTVAPDPTQTTVVDAPVDPGDKGKGNGKEDRKGKDKGKK